MSGGCSPYSFSWDDGTTSEDRFALSSGTYSVTITDQNGCARIDSFNLAEPAPFVVSGVVSQFACGYNISCQGVTDGSINLTVSGGCAPYSYMWSDGATTKDRSGIGAGTYSVTVTDANNCSSAQSYSLSEPSALTIGSTVSQYNCGFNVSCAGLSDASIDITPGGGCAPYNYLWSDGSNTEDRSGLGAGIYRVTVTDQNGCQDTASFTLQEPSALLINATLSEYDCGFNVSCHGLSDGSIDLGITGGCAGYSVNWADGDTNRMRTGLAAGMYQVTVSDQNGCSIPDSITLTEPNPLDIITEVITACEKRDLQATVTGGCASYQYLWNSGDTTAILEDIQPGNYTLTVTDQNGCSEIEGRNVTDTLIPLQVTVPMPTELPNCGEPGMLSASVEGGMGGYEYDWTLTSNQGSWSVIGGADSGIIRFTSGALGDTATFIMEVTDGNECRAQSSVKLWCENKYTDRVLLVWPNPTWRDLNIQFIEPDYIGNVKFEMYDVLGRKVRAFTEAMENELQLAMDLYPLAQGQYLLRLQLEGSDEWITKKIMVLR